MFVTVYRALQWSKIIQQQPNWTHWPFTLPLCLTQDHLTAQNCDFYRQTGIILHESWRALNTTVVTFLVLKLALALIDTDSLKEGDSRHTMHPPPPCTLLVEGLTSQAVNPNLPSSEPKPNWNRFIFQSYFLDPLETGYKSLEAQDPRLKLIASQHYPSHPYSLLAEGLPHSPRFGSAAAQTHV